MHNKHALVHLRGTSRASGVVTVGLRARAHTGCVHGTSVASGSSSKHISNSLYTRMGRRASLFARYLSNTSLMKPWVQGGKGSAVGVWARGRQRTWASFCTRHSWLPLVPKGGVQDACEAGVTGSNEQAVTGTG